MAQVGSYQEPEKEPVARGDSRPERTSGMRWSACVFLGNAFVHRFDTDDEIKYIKTRRFKTIEGMMDQSATL